MGTPSGRPDEEVSDMIPVQLLAVDESQGEIPSIWLGVGAFALFVVLLLITLSFNKHR